MIPHTISSLGLLDSNNRASQLVQQSSNIGQHASNPTSNKANIGPTRVKSRHMHTRNKGNERRTRKYPSCRLACLQGDGSTTGVCVSGQSGGRNPAGTPGDSILAAYTARCGQVNTRCCDATHSPAQMTGSTRTPFRSTNTNTNLTLHSPDLPIPAICQRTQQMTDEPPKRGRFTHSAMHVSLPAQ
jgi:hypothetical protein